jgi:sporulation protein YlmC with PRC-barrel domain
MGMVFASGAGAAPPENPPGKTVKGGTAVLQAASSFVGLEVRDSRGEKIGEVRDLLLDTRRELLVYAVIATGGLLGIGDDVVVVPWRFLSVRDGEKAALLAVPREKLTRTPKRTPEQSDEEFARAVEKFYGIPPYWEDRPEKRGRSGRSGGEGGNARDERSRSPKN